MKLARGLYAFIAECAEAHPDTPVLLSSDRTGAITTEMTYAELRSEIERAGAYLASIGLKAGDAVALDFGNSIEFLVLSWAAWCSGIITVPLDVKRDTAELRAYKVTASGAVRTLSAGDYKPVAGTPPAWCAGTEQTALILFTSGTTARPKGALLSLENLLVNADAIGDWLRIGPSDRFLVQLPLHHINSTTFCLSALVRGASIALSPGYSNSQFWHQASGTGATLTSIVQSILFDQLERTREYAQVKDRLKLSRIQIGSAPVMPASVLAFIEQFSIPLYQGYGQTETALRVTGVPMDLPPEIYRELIRENSIGEPLSWAEVAVLGEHGEQRGAGEEGELAVKGPAVMKGYAAGEPAFAHGYFMTGDVGFYKEIEGRRFFFLKGRKKEIIIKGGVNISPAAVEDALQRLSRDIAQAYVVGVPDTRYGEEVGAVVLWNEGVEPESALRRLKWQLYVGSPHLSAYETPKYIRVIKKDELPTTSTGKVQRTVLKEAPLDSYTSIYDLVQTSSYRFTLLTPSSKDFEKSLALHNHAWQPLTLDAVAYRELVQHRHTLLAFDPHGTLAGQIMFTAANGVFTCTSICSASYKPKPAPAVEKRATPQEVEAYLRAGNDGVYNFHVALGATLVTIIPDGRPEDKSSLGYTMLLAYPTTTNLRLTEQAPVSQQLIEIVRIIAEDTHARVEALSRPGGLARYLSEH